MQAQVLVLCTRYSGGALSPPCLKILRFVMSLFALPNFSPAVDVVELWSRPLGVLSTALNLSQVITERIASIEAELLLNMGMN